MSDKVATSSLIKKLSEILGEVGSIEKKGHNKAQNYDFVRETDVAEAIRKLLASKHIFLHLSVTSHQRDPLYQTQSGMTMWLTTVTVDGTWLDGDTGESLPAQTFIGYGADTGDKGVYKAMTGCEKYMLMKTFLISTGDDPESDEKVDKAQAARSAAAGGPRVVRTNRPGSQRGGRPTEPSAPQMAEVGRLIRELQLDGPAMVKLIKQALDKDVAAPEIRAFLTALKPEEVGTLIAAMTAMAATTGPVAEEANTEVEGDDAPTDDDDGFAIA